MQFDYTTCSRARKTRDPRFDGRIFIGVLTTGIYCRNICPAPSAKEKNVRYYSSSAAAADAGFRPCLRCRPECSPGTPAWQGTSSTVSHALRLISESPLDDGRVDALAARLGVGERHLRRLFLRHLGASPAAVVYTRRLHFAKKLIDETALPMSQVAVASGFGSVRRFNAMIRKTYQRAPMQIRKLAHNTNSEPANEYVFRLRFRAPFDWEHLLAFLAPRATPGVESVAGGVYRRTISIHDVHGSIEASRDSAGSAVVARIRLADPRWLFLVVERLRHMFDLNADPREVVTHLGADPLLRRSITAYPGLRVPGAWDGFEIAIRAILGQQVTVKGATTLTARLVREFGRPFEAGDGLTHLFPAAEALAAADLSKIGLPSARAQCIQELARAVRDGDLCFHGVLDVAAFLERFRQLPGIGHWTAQYVAMRAFADPDAFPASDLGLLKASGLRRPQDLEKRSRTWRPWRAYAAMHLWQGIAATRNARPPRRAIRPLSLATQARIGAQA